MTPKPPILKIVLSLPQFFLRLYRTSPTELYAALIALGWGLVLIAPQTSMQSAVVFSPFTVLLPESVWAWLTLGFGILGLVALGLGSLNLRHLFALLSTAFYSFVGCAFILRGDPFTAPIPYLILALFLFVNTIELARAWGRPPR